MDLESHVAQHGYGLAAHAIGMAGMRDLNERMARRRIFALHRPRGPESAYIFRIAIYFQINNKSPSIAVFSVVVIHHHRGKDIARIWPDPCASIFHMERLIGKLPLKYCDTCPLLDKGMQSNGPL